MGSFEFDRLESLSRVEKYVPGIKPDLDTVRNLLSIATKSAPTAEQGVALREAYNRCLEMAFPVGQKYLYWCHEFHGLSADHSLSSISWKNLKKLEEDSYTDPELKLLIDELKHGFSLVSQVGDSNNFRQAFEYYGEALVYGMLSKHFKTRKVDARDNSMPDFACLLPNGKEFFVEVKSLDIVDAPYRSNKMHEDAMQQQIQLEDQLKQGRLVAVAEREVAPYKGAFNDDSYDPRSLLNVISVLINKASSAFKSTQFKQGPTFAFILADRLVIPGGKHAVAPQYYERGGGAVVSGALWNFCFGQKGWPIFRMPDFEGKPGLEGYMSMYGLLADEKVPFPTGAVIVASTGSEDTLMGLYHSKWAPNPDWSEEETSEVMHALCKAYNDEKNSLGQLVSMT